MCRIKDHTELSFLPHFPQSTGISNVCWAPDVGIWAPVSWAPDTLDVLVESPEVPEGKISLDA